MKKITTLCLSLLCFAGVAQAQQTNKTFRFVEKHADGTTKEIPDGSTLNYTAADAEETPFGTQIKPALYVENTTGDLKAIALTLNIASINEGASIQFCAAGNCQSFDHVGEFVKNGMEAGKNVDDMMLEYIPKNDMDDEGNISKHQVMRLSFTYDHRLIDGVHIGKLYQMLQKMIELL